MTRKGIAIGIACLLFIGLEIFLIWNTVLYYQQKDDYNKAWQSGYDTALQAKDEYEKTIAQLQTEKLELTSELSTAQSTVESLTASNNALTTQVDTLTTQKTKLEKSVSELTQTKTENELTIQTLNTKVSSYEEQISTLQSEITANEESINSLNTQISNLNKQIANLQEDIEDNTAEIAELEQQKIGLENQVSNLNAQNSAKTTEINTLNNNITNLNNLVSKLQSTNDLQASIIENLNIQIVSLNTQISNLTLQINNNSGIVSNLQAKITQLENSIAYYEEYIAGLENGNQIVITAEFNGSVYNVQVINKGGKVSIVEPASTDYVIFNYWMDEDGTQLDLSTKTFNESTKIIANCTYKYDVSYYVDNSPVSEQIIVSNGFATDPSEPTKTGYEFDGWSLDGATIIDTTEYAITKNTIFYAVFTKLHTVQFNDGTQVVSTQTVRNGEYADPESVSVDSTQYKTFAGWTLGGSVVDVSSYKISADTVFTATYTYSYDVLFKTDGTTHASQIVQNGNYPSEPTTPTKDGYTFLGWSLNGTDIVSVTSTQITATTTFIAVWQEKIKTVSFVDIATGETLDTQTVTIGESATVPAKNGYTLNKVYSDSLMTTTLDNLNYTYLTNNTTYYVSYIFDLAGTWTNGNGIGGYYMSSNGALAVIAVSSIFFGNTFVSCTDNTYLFGENMEIVFNEEDGTINVNGGVFTKTADVQDVNVSGLYQTNDDISEITRLTEQIVINSGNFLFVSQAGYVIYENNLFIFMSRLINGTIEFSEDGNTITITIDEKTITYTKIPYKI